MSTERNVEAHASRKSAGLRTAVRATAAIWIINALIYALVTVVAAISYALEGTGASVPLILLPAALAVVSGVLVPLLWSGRRAGYWISAAVSGVVLAGVVYAWVTSGWILSGLVFILNAIPLVVSVAALILLRTASDDAK